MSDRHQTVNSNSNFPSEKEKYIKINQFEKKTESAQDQTSVEPNTNFI